MNHHWVSFFMDLMYHPYKSAVADCNAEALASLHPWWLHGKHSKDYPRQIMESHNVDYPQIKGDVILNGNVCRMVMTCLLAHACELRVVDEGWVTHRMITSKLQWHSTARCFGTMTCSRWVCDAHCLCQTDPPIPDDTLPTWDKTQSGCITIHPR